MSVLAGRQGTARGKLAVLCLLTVLVAMAIAPRWQRARAADDKDATPAASTANEKPAKTNIVVHILQSAGPVFGGILGLVSVAMVTIVVILAMDLRLGNCIPPFFVEEFTDTVNKRRFKEAFELARNDNSFVGRVLTAGMSRLQYGLEDAREAALNATDSVKASKDQLVTYLATIGTLGPMLGLVGTVFGMIETFMVMGEGGTPNPAELAKGISHALVITLIGIAISVPAIFCHAFFRNRLTRVSMDSANIADDLLTQMYHNSRKPPAPEPRVATANAVPAAAPATVKPAP